MEGFLVTANCLKVKARSDAPVVLDSWLCSGVVCHYAPMIGDFGFARTLIPTSPKTKLVWPW